MDNNKNQNLDVDRLPVKIKWASPSKAIIFPKQTKMSQENKKLLEKIRAYKQGL